MGRYGSDKAFEGLDQVTTQETQFGGGDPKAALRDPRFLQTLKDHYRSQGVFVGTLTDQQLIEKFYSDRNWADLNTLGAVNDAASAYGMSPEDRARARAIQQVWNDLPNMFQDGGRGWGAAPDVATALVFDPVNLIGGVAGKGAATATTRGAIAAGKTASQATRQGIRAGVTRAGLTEGAVGAGAEAAIDTAIQHRDMALGLQDEFSYGRLAGSTAMGGTLGVGAGALLNIPSSVVGAREGAEQVEMLRRVGIDDESIGALSNRGAATLMRDPTALGDYVTEKSMARQAEEAAAAAAAEPETVPAETPDIAAAKLEEAIASQRSALDSLRADEADPDMIADAERTLNALARLRGMATRLEKEANEINELAETNDPKSLATAAKRRAIFERDFADFRALMDGADDEEIEGAIRRFEARTNPQPKEADAPEPAAADSAAEPADAGTAPDPEPVPADAAPAAEEPSPAPEAAPEAEPVTQPTFGSTAARDLAARLGFEPEDIPPTGRKGRILLKDVQAHAENAGDSNAGDVPDVPAREAPTVASKPDQEPTGNEPKIAPKAQAAAERAGLDWRNIPPQSNGVTITRGDVRAYQRAIKANGGEAPAARVDAADQTQLTELEKRRALAAGIDWQAAVAARPDLSPKGAVVDAMRRARQAHAKTGKVSEDTHIGALRAKVAEVMELADADGAQSIQDVQDIIAGLAEETSYADFGDDIGRYLDVLMEKAHERGLLFDDPIDEFPDVELTATQQKRAKEIARALRAEEPDLSNEMVVALAKNHVLTDEVNLLPGKSHTRSSGDAAVRASIFESAGRTNSGRIQGFLRRSSPIAKGSEYGIGGDVEYPMAHKFSLDAALVEARGSRGDGRGLVAFIATGSEPVKLKGQKGFGTVPKGTTLYADGITGNAYADEAYARFMRGETSAKGSAEDIVAQPAAGRNQPKKAKETAKSPEQFKRNLEAKRDGKTIAEEVPVEDGDKLLIIRNKESGQLRMMTKRQAAEGKTLRDILGKADPDDWEVNYAPNPKSRSQSNLNKLWNSLNEAPEQAKAEGTPTDAGEAFTPDGPPPRLYDEARQSRVELSSDEAAVIEEALGHAGVTIRLNESNTTAGALLAVRHGLETAGWNLPLEQRARGLATISEAMTRAIPEGVFWDQPTRVESVRQVRQIFDKYSVEEGEQAARFVESLVGEYGPTFIEHRGANPGHVRDYASGENHVQLNPRAEQFSPRLMTLYHEVGHWAYFNILTDADRAEFWRAMEKHEAAGPEGRKAFLAVGGEVQADGKSMRMNDDLSPQELWANQFSMFVARKTQGMVADEGYWKRMVHYVKAIFDRFLRDAQIDPDLEPLFARILPDDAEAAKFRANVIDIEATSKMGLHTQKRLVELRAVREGLEDAIARGSHSGIINAHHELTTMLMSLAPKLKGKRPDLKAGEQEFVTFGPIKKLIPIIRNRVSDFDEIMGRKGQGGNFSDGAKELDTILDGDAAVSAAEALTDFFHNGYMGEFQPEGGVPARIKRLEDTSTVALLDMLYNAMELAYKKAENGHLPPGTKPASAKARVAKRATEGKPVVASKGRAKAKAKAARIKRRADGTASEWSVRAKEAHEHVAGLGDGAEFANLRGMSIQKLRNRVKTQDGDVNWPVAYELKQKLQARDLPKTKVTVDHSIVELSNRNLENSFYEAVASGDKNAISQTSYEMTRRAAKKRGDAAAKLTRPQTEELRQTVAREIEHAAGPAEQIGIPPNAPAAVRELLSYMTHRDPEVTATMRTIGYRMLNLMGKTAHRALDQTSILSAADVARMAGVDPSEGGPAVFADFRSPAFRQLRADQRRLAIGLTKGATDPLDLMHEVGHMVVRSGLLPDTEADAIREMYRTAKGDVKDRVTKLYSGKYAHRSADEREALLADEWFAEEFAKFMAERVTRGDIYEGGTALASRFGMALDRTVEYVSYLLNGLLGRKDLRQTFRRVMFYGDMFDAPKRNPLADLPTQSHLAPELAAPYAQDVLRSSPKERIDRIMAFVGHGYGRDSTGPKTFFHGTPNGTALRRETSPDAVVKMSQAGHFGPGFYVTGDPVPADEVYARSATPSAIVQKIMDDNPNLTDDQIFEITDLASELLDIRTELGAARLQLGEKMMEIDSGDEVTAFLAEQEIEGLYNAVIELATEANEVLDLLERAGYSPDDYVAPVYIRLENPADFRFGSVAEDHADFINALAARLDIGGFQLNALDSMEDVYDTFVTQIGYELGLGKVDAQARMNTTLKEMGYDGLLTTHVNSVSVDGSSNIPGLGVSYASQRVAHDVPVLFSAEQVKHVEASHFDAQSPELYRREAEALPSLVNSTLIEGIMTESIEQVTDVMPSSISATVERKGSTSLGSALMSMMRGRAPTPREEAALMQRGPKGWFKSQASHMRYMGMNWLADWYEPHFSDAHQAFAQRFWPLHRQLAKLPDAEGAIKGWARRATGGIGQKQPRSHVKIMSALRRPSGSRAEAALTTQERAAYQSIREAFRKERKTLTDLGLFMGNRGDDYLPQVWDTAKIEKNPEEFRSGMASYFEIEANKAGKEFQPEEALAFADRMYARLTGEETHGVFIPQAAAGSRNPSADNLDFSRMIELDRHPEALKGLEKFLENDLEAVLTKYFEGTSRRATFIDKMGVNSHALYDYMQVVDLGAEGIARLLATDKVFQKDFNVLDWEAKPDVMRLETVVPMPFSGDEGKAMAFAKELVAAHEAGGPGAARDMLTGIAPRTVHGEIPLAYTRRAEAIIGAMDDFNGKASDLKNPEFNFVEDAMRVAMRKRRHGVSEEASRMSGYARSFNNVSLLSFTTLTSLGDLALPLIRSGSMKDYTSALKKFATDPDYRDMIAGTGVAIENIVHDRMLHMFGATDTKLSAAFFNATGLTPWTDMNRKIAGAVGYEAVKSMQAKANRQFKEGVPLAQQATGYKTAHRFLTSVGLQEFLPTGSRAHESLSNTALLETDDVVRQSVIRFADKAIFTPNANDIPLWAQTPVGALLFQLKSFPLMMGRMSADVVKEAKQGNVTPLLYFATFGPAFGMGALAAKDVIQMRGGDDGQSPELRKRNALKVLGYDEEVHGNEDDFLGWYLEGMMMMGGLGLLGDVAVGIASQVENGAYGQVRVASLLGGPTVGNGFAAMTVMGGVTDGSDSNAKERAATREIATRIPVLGGIRKARESIVDMVSGEADDGGHWSRAQTGYDWK